MPGILFLQTDWLDRLGIMYLSAALKARGIGAQVVITRSPRTLLKEAQRVEPELVAVSLAGAGHQAALDLLAKARPFLKPKVVLGGPHPTFFPEALAHPAVDFIIRGEAEDSLPGLIFSLRQGQGLERVPSLGYKQDGRNRFNPPGKLSEDLDQVPFPDRRLYFRYGYYRRMGMQRVLTCRGCPYNCAYCFNAALREYYRGQGKYVRQRSATNVIAELKQMRHFTRTVNFADDSFGLNREFADEFLDQYPREIGLPFIVNLRPEQVDQDFASRLARAGCYCAQVGIESGNDQLREQLLGRKVSKEEIRAAVRRLKEQGVKVLSYNMLGLPGEGLDQGLETIALNRELEVDFPRFSIFQPYPGTALGEEAVRKGLASRQDLEQNLSGSYFRQSPLKSPETRLLENLHKLYALAIRCPGAERMIKKLVKLPANPLFQTVFLVSIAAQYRRATNRSLRETVEYGLRNLALY